jgi:hypothetical protein
MIIPFGVGPAVVAGGWAGIILRMRDHPPWLLLGIGSALIGLALVAASLLCLVVFGPQGRDAGATGSGPELPRRVDRGSAAAMGLLRPPLCG